MENREPVKRIGAAAKPGRVWIAALVFIALLAALAVFFVIRNRGKASREAADAVPTDSPAPTEEPAPLDTPVPSESAQTQPPQLILKTAIYIDGEKKLVLASRQAAEELIQNVERHFLTMGDMPGDAVTELSTDIAFFDAEKNDVPISYDEAFAYLTGNRTPLIYQSRAVYATDTVVPHSVEYVEDDTLFTGLRMVEVYGTDGLERENHSVTYVNGVKVADNVVESFTVRPLVNGRIRVGTLVTDEEFELTQFFGETPFFPDSLVFDMPVEGEIVMLFGPYEGTFHQGIDVQTGPSAEVRAACGGTVVSVMERGSFGLLIEIDHGYGVVTRYARLGRAFVSIGDTVEAGALIGTASDGAELYPVHFEFRIGGIAYNPMKLFGEPEPDDQSPEE